MNRWIAPTALLINTIGACAHYQSGNHIIAMCHAFLAGCMFIIMVMP